MYRVNDLNHEKTILQLKQQSNNKDEFFQYNYNAEVQKKVKKRKENTYVVITKVLDIIPKVVNKRNVIFLFRRRIGNSKKKIQDKGLVISVSCYLNRSECLSSKNIIYNQF